jgi:catechol 2,3-dioxygenase-like lactoylglutathione lyase family enzyme
MKDQKPDCRVRFHHVGIVVKDISEAIDKYAVALGVDRERIALEDMSYVTGKGETEEFRYAFLPLAEGESNFIELVQPTTAGPTARYLEKHVKGFSILLSNRQTSRQLLKNSKKLGYLRLEPRRPKMFCQFSFIQSMQMVF